MWRVRSGAAARIPAVHRALRIVSTMLITAGLVVLADVGLTLVWQEPLSAVYGSIQQGQAADQLNRARAQYPTPADLAGDRRSAAAAPRRRASSPTASSRTSRRATRSGGSRSTGIGLDIVVVQGTDTASLQKGPGHYPNTPFPGQPGTVAIAGHRTTYLAPFRHIDQIENGDEIRVEMPYAAFTYTVQRHEIVDPSDVGIIKPVGYDQLVLTACHPLYSAAQRYAVFAKLSRVDLFAVSGEGRWTVP